jgi:hypothetical protein
MTPNEIDKIVSKLTAQGKSQREIRDEIARMQGKMAPEPEKPSPPPSDDPPPPRAA